MTNTTNETKRAAKNVLDLLRANGGRMKEHLFDRAPLEHLVQRGKVDIVNGWVVVR